MPAAESDPAPWVAALRARLLDRLGHDVPEARARGVLVAYAADRARALGLAGPERWAETLADPASAEWRGLVRAATVGETHFFRHREQLRAIVSAAAALARARGRPLAIWSAGCATGDEAWTLAMLLAEAGVPARILGTDVNEDSIEAARRADGYGDRSVGHVPATLRERHFAREGARWRLVSAASLGVSFASHNLARDAAPRAPTPEGRFDVVLCRNVLLYFPDAVVRAVLAVLLGAVAPGGGVWLGPADIVPTDLARRHRRMLDGERYLSPEEPPTPAATDAGSPGAGAAPRSPSGAARPRPVAEPTVDVLLDRGLVATAEEVLERRVHRSRGDAEAWTALAAIALARHDLLRALELLDGARAAGPSPGTSYLRAVALTRAARHDEAYAELLEALAFEPDDWAASLLVALHFRRLRRSLQEEVALERALALLEAPDPRPPDHGPCARLVESVHRDPDAARSEVRRALDAIAAARGAVVPGARP